VEQDKKRLDDSKKTTLTENDGRSKRNRDEIEPSRKAKWRPDVAEAQSDPAATYVLDGMAFNSGGQSTLDPSWTAPATAAQAAQDALWLAYSPGCETY
jgi:hypothetical protein